MLTFSPEDDERKEEKQSRADKLHCLWEQEGGVQTVTGAAEASSGCVLTSSGSAHVALATEPPSFLKSAAALTEKPTWREEKRRWSSHAAQSLACASSWGRPEPQL